MTKIHYDSDYQQLNGRNTSGETFRTREGTIDEVVYSTHSTIHGTRHLLNVNIAPSPDLIFHPNRSIFLGPHQFSYHDEKDITELLQDFRVTKPEELCDKKVTIYLQQCLFKAGISLPGQTKLPMFKV
ncbi:hypothetical protein HY484_03320 [Candidatus Woesearchaeota archaeon]|nr:hypothetical protein [Candidatus Woesearchaeota archaeon]